MNEKKEGLLERVGDRRRLLNQDIELFFNLVLVVQWLVTRIESDPISLDTELA